MKELLDEYERLLNGDFEEKVYQDFLEENTQFIPRHFVQNHGVHMSLALRKLKISNDMVTDFVILSKSSMSWNYILIEIEKPSSQFFRSGTKKVHPEFLGGVAQINSWKAWFSKPGNKAHFEAQLSFIKKPVSNAPVDIKYVLVTGRRSEYEKSDDKINIVRTYESEDFKVMSFDSLADGAKNNDELYLGIRKQNSIELKTKKLLDVDFLDWCDDSDFQLSIELKNIFMAYLEKEKKSFDVNSSVEALQCRHVQKVMEKVVKMKVLTN